MMTPREEFAKKNLAQIDNFINIHDADSARIYVKDQIKILTLLDNLLNSNDSTLVKKIINSINENQVESKEWLIRKSISYLDLYEKPKILIIAGWFGLLGNMLQYEGFDDITILDLDPTCKIIGPQIYDGLKFITNDIKDFNVDEYDIIICTACEHLTDETINNFINDRKDGSLVILQSNNYYGIDGHINCKDTLNDFKKSLNIRILESKSKDIGPYTRYLVIGGF